MKKSMLKYTLMLGLLAVALTNTEAQNRIKWMSWEDALAANKLEPRKLVVDIYTEWCSWCKKMDAATFQKDHIAKYVNNNYYAVKFDAETREDITYNGKVYKYVSNGKRGYHELALSITQGKLSYPTVTFIDENLDVIQPIGGFQDPKNFEMIMTYFAGDHHKSTPWKAYSRNYNARQQQSAPVPVKGN